MRNQSVARQKSICTDLGRMLEFSNPCEFYMRIQEMRSGLLHLKNKMENERTKNIFETGFEHRPIGQPFSEPPPANSFASQLDEPRWAVVSFERREALGLTYPQAVRRLNELDSQGLAGLCIVTHEAAASIN